MTYQSGSAEVSDKPAVLCGVPDTGVKIRNLGEATIYVGGEYVSSEGSTAGYPIEAGTSETIQGVKPKESPVVPAPPGDIDSAVLWACTASGSGPCRVSWISVT